MTLTLEFFVICGLCVLIGSALPAMFGAVLMWEDEKAALWSVISLGILFILGGLFGLVSFVRVIWKFLGTLQWLG